MSSTEAVDNESIEVNQEYFNSTKRCKNIFVFHSERDDVLKFLYALAEHDKALGYEGAQDVSLLPKNVQLIDCTAFVDSHSGYFTACALYQFIQNQHTNRISSVSNARLLSDGFLEAVIPKE